MEDGKQVGYSSSSSSSFANDLFGAKESVQSPAASGTISALFPPPSAVLGTRSSVVDQTADRSKHYMGYMAGNRGGAEYSSRNKEVGCYCTPYKEGNPIFKQKSNPCNLSSSIFYGGQEDMFVDSSNATHSGSYLEVKKGGGGEDKNGDDPNIASRGNWWEGSLYY